MWIAECPIDARGRITLPSSFMRANNLDTHTKIFIQSIANNENTVKMVFIKEDKDGQVHDKEQHCRSISNSE